MPSIADERVLFTLTIVILTGLTVGSILGTGAPTHPQSTATASPPSDVRVTDDGTRYVVNPAQLRQGCPGGPECIPAIDNPTYQPANQADWLADEDLVIGIQMGGETRAYPLRILNVHEIVNTEIGDRAIAVTYCPLCRSGLVFDRTIDETTLSLGVSGKLLNANLVMYDRETETYWSQLNGTAVVGPLVPAQLDILPNTITEWGDWRSEHPETVVLSRNTGIYPAATYSSDPYSGYTESDRVGFGVQNVDERLGPKVIVYGVTVGNTSRAYPDSVVERERVINDVVAGVPVLVVADPGSGGIRVFVREVDGDAIKFRTEDDRLVDAAGGEWTYTGTAVAGPHSGAELARLNSHGIYWFAWSQFNPDTGVYPADATNTTRNASPPSE